MCRILLVEDDSEDRLIVHNYLERACSTRFIIEDATRLQEALEKLSAEQFDIVLLDLHLPDCSGLDTVDFLKSRWNSGPIIVLTGLDDELTGVDAVRHGAQDYLSKDTLSPALLSRTVRYAIERHKFTYLMDASKQSQDKILAEFCNTLREPISELLNAASNLCEKTGALGSAAEHEVEIMSSSASRLLTLLNNASSHPPDQLPVTVSAAEST